MNRHGPMTLLRFFCYGFICREVCGSFHSFLWRYWVHPGGLAHALGAEDRYARGEGRHIFVLLKILIGVWDSAVYGSRNVVVAVVWISTRQLEEWRGDFVFSKSKRALRRATEWWGQHHRKNKQTKFDGKHWGTGEVPHLSWCYRCYESAKTRIQDLFSIPETPHASLYGFLLHFHLSIKIKMAHLTKVIVASVPSGKLYKNQVMGLVDR